MSSDFKKTKSKKQEKTNFRIFFKMLAMKPVFFLLLFFRSLVFSFEFDYVFIGSSPFCLLEALYQNKQGNKVLILEKDSCCGGAWKSLDLFGLSNIDLGCHQIGNDLKLKHFFESYIGCQIVSLDQPHLPFSPKEENGWYFSRGCFELIEKLLNKVRQTDILILLNTEAKEIFLSLEKKQVLIETNEQTFLSKKLIVTPKTDVRIAFSKIPSKKARMHYHHLYLLIEDPTPFRFTYQKRALKKTLRVMNLTPFVNMKHPSHQLIVFQTYQEGSLDLANALFQELKDKNLLSEQAKLLSYETHSYSSGFFPHQSLAFYQGQTLVEVLKTTRLQNLLEYLPKWEKSFH